MFTHLHRWAVLLLSSPKPSCFITILPAADEVEAFEVREMCGSEGTRTTNKRTQKSLPAPLVMQKLFHSVADAVGTCSHPLALPVSEPPASQPPAPALLRLGAPCAWRSPFFPLNIPWPFPLGRGDLEAYVRAWLPASPGNGASLLRTPYRAPVTHGG